MTNYLTRTVSVRADLAEAQAVTTLAHELAHVMLHDPDRLAVEERTQRDRTEVEAESVAHLVTVTLELDAAGYTFPYVARSADRIVDLIQGTASRVIDTARTIVAHAATE